MMLATPLPSRADKLVEARDLHGQGRITEAEAVYRLLIDHDPDDAEALHLLGVAQHQAGHPQQAEATIRRALNLAPDLAAAWQNYVLPLLELDKIDDAVAAGAEAVRLTPEKIGARGNYVLALVRAGRLDEAALSAEEGIALDPDAAALWSQLGHIRIEQRHLAVGEALLRRALTLDANLVEAHYNLGVTLQSQKRDIEAIAAYDDALRRDPTHRGARLNMGVSMRNLGRIGDALAVWNASPVPADAWADLDFNIACAHLLAGRWAQAWTGWERRTDTVLPVEYPYSGSAPRWRGENIAGKTLLVVHEQGLGDTVQFARFLPRVLARCGRVILICQPQLRALLSCLTQRQDGLLDIIADGGAVPAHDVHVPLMSLPALMDARPETVPRSPYLTAGEDRVERWRDHLRSAGFGQSGDRRTFRVGLVWQGNPNAPVEFGRSIPLEAFRPLGDLAGTSFVALQKGAGANDRPPPGLSILKLPEDFDSGPDAFLDTAAISSLLDIVITSDTSVAHVLGALGRPVWLLLKYVPDWRWGLEGMLTPWYPTVRVFRQKTAGDWHGLLREVAQSLAKLTDLLAFPSVPAPETLNDLFRTAVALHEAGRLAEAVPIYRGLVAARPMDGRLLNMFGMAIMEAGKRSPAALAEAMPYVMRSAALSPGEPDFLSNLAVLLDKMGLRGDARRAIEHAMAVEPDHQPSHLTLANIEAAEGQLDQAMARIRGVIARTPGQASGYSSYAGLATQAGRNEEAAVALRRAVELEPDNPRILVQFGAALMATGEEAQAARAWERALSLKPGNADALGNLGVYERSYGDVGVAEWLHAEAARHEPAQAEAHSNRGIAAADAGRVEAAVAAFREAVRIRPNYADARMALGMALIGQGRWAEGLQEYEWRLQSERLGMAKTLPRLPLWRGESPVGKSFLAMCEQGFGDAIQFVRYVRLLKEAGASKVYVGCRSKLAALLATAEGVDGIVEEGSKIPQLDYVTYLMSLPLRLGTTETTIPGRTPYLAAEPERVERWAVHLAARPGFRIGLIWQGNPDPQIDKGRSMALRLLEPLSQIADVRLIALQKGFGSEQLAEVADRFAVEDLGAQFDNGPDAFVDTAAVIMNLDLVISTDTAVCHLAGALGKPVWIFLKERAEWRWLEARGDSPWYPTARLFRQYPGDTGPDVWSAVIARLCGEVAGLVAGDRSRLYDRAETGVRPALPAPLSAQQNFALGLKAHEAGDKQTAVMHYGRVLVDEPDFAEAMHMLGAAALQDGNWARAYLFLHAAQSRGLATPEFKTNFAVALRNLGRHGEAETLARSAVAEKPTSEACLTLGNVLRDREKYEEAVEAMTQAVRLGPKSQKARRGLANTLKDVGRLPEALDEFDRAVAAAPDDAELHLDRAHALLYSGAFAAGFAEYEWRMRASEMVPRSFDVPRWNGKKFAGKTLLIHGEQGLGDHIQFARFIPDVVRLGGHVVLEVRRPLFGLLRTLTLPWDKVTITEQGLPLPPHDLEVPLLSLPHALRSDAKKYAVSVPYLHADRDRVARWAKAVNRSRLSVGLIWQGNPKARADKGRSPPLEALRPILSLPGIQFVTLQKEHGLEQLRGDQYGMIERPGVGFDDGPDAFLDTAALMMSLDCIVTSDTAAAHLAGALGRPTYLMLKSVPDWRWTVRRDSSVWYPTMQLFRQPEPGDWASVAERLRVTLMDRAGQPK